ncbi:hypothetical protein RFI36_04665 [Acinetobacter gerneri]|uniref:Uncharacterized protein n=1 Tax=Acinetobacter gerneri TaxID=202952 RepID=A0AAW8JHH5_9GAMM|nr:hypothetical protein [Acinetobacter gerneri]MDQ9009038.1 hypothetical protein [Acinetobacter gerneri]MDQ9013142.1 hypothetical protein [Acinetobacter gerneri]MDQ9024579.1 hypothetical protein [Acinetobacter gerneri]MDQ9051814.1 hypothetical protein [Acinetobacter gerneri]MDQ9059205.1 hypothetical protein [Acinetobacter gerneri]
MLSTGRDFEYLRSEFDIPRLKALNAYQSKVPPVEVGVQRLCRLIEAFMGIEDSSNQQNDDEDDDLFSDLANFPQGG